MRTSRSGGSVANVITAGALILFSTLTALLVAEIGARLVDGVSVFDTENFISAQLDIIRANNGALVFDPTVGWALKPNIPGENFTTGAYGIRQNSNTIIEPPQNGVLAVGDSFTAGSGVSNKDTWPAQLERLASVPVVNAGVGGFSVAQMFLVAQRLVPIVHPKTIVFGILSEDVLRDAYDLFGGGYKPWFRVEDGKAALEGVPVPRVSSRPPQMDWVHAVLGHSELVHRFMMKLGFGQWWLADRLRYLRAQTNEEAVKSTCALMDDIVKLGRDASAHVIVVIFWGAAQVMTDPPAWYAADVASCASERKLDVVNLYSTLRAIGTTEPEKFKTLWIDEGGVLGHPSAAGNLITAQQLEDLFFSQATAQRTTRK